MLIIYLFIYLYLIAGLLDILKRNSVSEEILYDRSYKPVEEKRLFFKNSDVWGIL